MFVILPMNRAWKRRLLASLSNILRFLFFLGPHGRFRYSNSPVEFDNLLSNLSSEVWSPLGEA